MYIYKENCYISFHISNYWEAVQYLVLRYRLRKFKSIKFEKKYSDSEVLPCRLHNDVPKVEEGHSN